MRLGRRIWRLSKKRSVIRTFFCYNHLYQPCVFRNLFLKSGIIYFRKYRCQGDGIGNADVGRRKAEGGIFRNLEVGSREERIKNNILCLPEISDFTKQKPVLKGLVSS